jgi:hypothetical protein
MGRGGRYRRFAPAHLNDPAANGLAAAISLLGGGPPVIPYFSKF